MTSTLFDTWPQCIFVTGTDTDVGKTIATAAIGGVLTKSGRSVAIYKPAQTGLAPDETGDAQTAATLAGITSVCEGARLPEPLAPTMAARRAGLPLPTLAEHSATIAALAESHDKVLIEGAGGLLVGLGSNDETLRDLIALHPGCGVVVTIRAALGTLNHSLLTTQALERLDLGANGLIIGSMPPADDAWEATVAHENSLEVQRLTGWPLLASIPEGQGIERPDVFQSHAATWFNA